MRVCWHRDAVELWSFADATRTLACPTCMTIWRERKIGGEWVVDEGPRG